MGGFTGIRLKDNSEANIKRMNALLDAAGVNKRYRFYSIADVQFEYDGFVKGTGVFPEDQFPRKLINSFEDFRKYWSTEALGEIFVPKFGTLTLDCYFGRTSKRAMRMLGRFFADNHREIGTVYGSWSTFMERGMTKIERQIIAESEIRERYS